MGLREGGLKKKITVLKRRKMQRKRLLPGLLPRSSVHRGGCGEDKAEQHVRKDLLVFRSFSWWESPIALPRCCCFTGRFVLVLISSRC